MAETSPHPISLPSNQPPARFYQGGLRISDFRREAPAASNTPEDWVGSTTSVRGHSPIGMTRLPDGRLLADAVAADPLAWLGPDHVERFGADTMLLVKLLDAGQRLPIHAHPDGPFAAQYLGSVHGKAEAWYILTPGTVFLGLRDDIDASELWKLVDTQQTERMLALMHPVAVQPHDTVYVPPGLLHAIGEGILLAEVQEPEDLSILLEWTGFDLDGTVDGHLGLGFDLALAAVETRGRTVEEIAALLRRRGGGSDAAADGSSQGVVDGAALVTDSKEYFRLDRVTSDRDLPAGFTILIALEGSMVLATGAGAGGGGGGATADTAGSAPNWSTFELPAGTTVLLPFAAGAVSLTGEGTVLVARPPEPR